MFEYSPCHQQAPYVDFDDAGNIVVCWGGVSLLACSSDPQYKIFVRRFHWSGNPADPITALRPQVVVNYWVDSRALPAMDANPVVALSREPAHAGRFVVAWNAIPPEGGADPSEIHARYFDANGRPQGPELRVNQAVGPTDIYGNARRRLGEASQHTIAYTATSQVVVAWTAWDEGYPSQVDQQVYLTILPPGYAGTACAGVQCLKGDCNSDGLVNGDDIQRFVNVLFNGFTPTICAYEQPISDLELCRYDINRDCAVDTGDVAAFVCLLVHGAANCTPGGDGPSGPAGGESALAAPPDSASGNGASTPSPPSPREAVRAFVQWLDANLRASHPELTDSEHYKLIKRKLRELGLLPE